MTSLQTTTALTYTIVRTRDGAEEILRRKYSALDLAGQPMWAALPPEHARDVAFWHGVVLATDLEGARWHAERVGGRVVGLDVPREVL